MTLAIARPFTDFKEAYKIPFMDFIAEVGALVNNQPLPAVDTD